MAKDYNIDDIISEVNKRKSAELKEDIKPEKKETPELKIEEIEKEKPEPVVEDIEPKPEAEVENNNQDEYIDISSGAKDEIESDNDFVEPEKLNLETVGNEDESNSNVQLDDFDEYSEEKPKKKKKGKKIAIAIICIILAILIAGGFLVYHYVDNMFSSVSVTDDTSDSTEEDTWTGMDTLVENFTPIDEAEASKIASLKDMIKQWYYNGEPCSSSHVLNIMLMGEDGYDEADGTRADSAIIASVNIDTGTIYLTSILRDTYAYWEETPGDATTGTFGKINAARSTNGIPTYINAVEKLYKVQIDYYATVDFESFKTIIDTLGGVEIEITQAEINEINNDQKTYDGTWIDKTFEGTSGVMKLDGQQALSYCRIRHLDSDNMRADRQKKCLNAIFEGVKDASTTELLKILNDVIPYVTTSMPKDTLWKVAKYALSQGWMDYKIQMSTVPNSRINESGAGGIYYGAWCWKSDFPQDAYNLQMTIYGKSSITLAKTRVDVLNCKETGFFSEGASAVSATIVNKNYGEVTTVTTTQEETTESTTVG